MPYITRCPKISNGLLPKAIQAASRMAQHFSNVSPWKFLCLKNTIILHALVYVESRMEPSSGVCVYVLQVIFQKAVVQSLQCLQDWSAFLKVVVSPWCNNNGWLGVKHQVTYFSRFCICHHLHPWCLHSALVFRSHMCDLGCELSIWLAKMVCWGSTKTFR